jgi:hypothetical protein
VNRHDEEGQVLVLTLAFLLFATLVISAILTFADSSERSTVQLRGQRNTVYSADGATDAAIQTGRKDTTVGAYGDPRCQSSNPSTSTAPTLLTTKSNGGTVANVICTWSSDPLQPDRTVTYTAFVAGRAEPVVQAQVIYHDATAGSGGTPHVFVKSWTYCGHSTAC